MYTVLVMSFRISQSSRGSMGHRLVTRKRQRSTSPGAVPRCEERWRRSEREFPANPTREQLHAPEPQVKLPWATCQCCERSWQPGLTAVAPTSCNRLVSITSIGLGPELRDQLINSVEPVSALLHWNGPWRLSTKSEFASALSVEVVGFVRYKGASASGDA